MNDTSAILEVVNDGHLFFLLFSILPALLLCPIWLATKFMDLKTENNNEEDADEHTGGADSLAYEECYRVPAQSDNASKETFLSNLVLEETPKGLVIMRYNKEEEGFDYWADTNIDYKYLDTVARKYVHSFDCLGVYINRYEMLRKKMFKLRCKVEENKYKMEQESKKSEEAEQQKGEEDTVFAVLKNVKRKMNKYKTVITKNDIVCDAANKFVCRGKLKDSKKWLKDDMPAKEKKLQAFGWFEWKNLKRE